MRIIRIVLIYVLLLVSSSLMGAAQTGDVRSDDNSVFTEKITIVDLKKSMDLAGQSIINSLNPSNNYLPYFWLKVNEQYQLELGDFQTLHNLGRTWDGLIRIEDATGFVIPEHIDKAYVENLHRYFNNPDNIFCRPFEDLPDPPNAGVELFDFHSQREGLLALTALVKYRKDSWAAKKAHEFIVAIDKVITPDETWLPNPGNVLDVVNTVRYKNAGSPPIFGGWGLSGIVSQGRLIEALIWHYELTNDPLALDLAKRFSEFHLENTTSADGQHYARWDAASDPKVMRGHTHSYLGVLRGLLLYGEISGKQEYIDRIVATYRTSLPAIVKKSGYACHDLGKDIGHASEISSPGDLAQLGLWLGVRHGYTEFLDDTERIVRARIIPSQITKSLPVKGVLNDDSPLKIEERIIGAYGGVPRMAHAGKQSVIDVTGAVLHTLADIYKHIAVLTDENLTIYLHFNYEDKNIRVTSVRAKEAELTVVAKLKKDLRIRIPNWTPKDSIRLKVKGKTVSVQIDDQFIDIPKRKLPAKVVLTYALPIYTETENTDGVDYELTWRGDEIIGIYPNNDFYPFYPTLKKD